MRCAVCQWLCFWRGCRPYTSPPTSFQLMVWLGVWGWHVAVAQKKHTDTHTHKKKQTSCSKRLPVLCRENRASLFALCISAHYVHVPLSMHAGNNDDLARHAEAGVATRVQASLWAQLCTNHDVPRAVCHPESILSDRRFSFPAINYGPSLGHLSPKSPVFTITSCRPASSTQPPDSAALLIRASPPPDTRCPLTDTKLHWQLLSEQRGECLVRAVGLVLSLLSFRSELPSVKFKEIAGEVFGPQRPSDAKEMNAAFER